MYKHLRVTLANTLRRLEHQLNILDKYLKEEDYYPLWVWHENDPSRARIQVRQIVTAIDYCDGQDPVSTRICPALVGVGTTTLTLIQQINETKAALHQALKNMDGIKIEEWTTHNTYSLKPLIKITLASLGHARLHRRQAIRKFVTLEDTPESVSFIWSRLPKIESIDIKEAYQRLETRLEKGSGSALLIEEDLRRLSQLNPNDRLAIIAPPHIHPRANIAWFTEEGTTRRAQKRAVIPIFYPATRYDSLPRLRPLPDDPQLQGLRLRRNDATIETTPYLLTIRAHRYLH
ncbi:DNA replication terminus site-binding family protein [Candidatus Nitrosoglobus terrae]|uniref:DNA replication terminus site-binding family protein n=1 Tax=Candidatus Nitrosoglobus terrae TaxID=1630141 RepID=A0A1Q2SMR2_9GAMM|nr:DNA replication terminus site-binding protein [Candidatus Nitrosoglobus terrae]BAW80403.1 DNA replication terminus site-binding family protein [Candidatus Nitrosoglobus terrae]